MSAWNDLSPYDRLVNTDLVAPRDYQINIVKSLLTGRNTLVILPTGLGKTLIAVFGIASVLHNGKKAIMLAPTRPLSEQHYDSLTSLLNIEKESILLLTGSISGDRRTEMEEKAKVIAATPQTISNDLKAGRLSMQDVGMVIFDECHKAIGKYAYTHIADECKLNGVQLVGLTASPGSDRKRIDEIVDTLNIQNIEVRIASDKDVEAYVMGKQTTTLMVDKTPQIDSVMGVLKPVIEEHLGNLYSKGLSPFKYIDKMPKGRLIAIGDTIRNIQAPNYKYMAMFNYVYVLDLLHAYDLVATEGLSPFLSYMRGLRDREAKSRAVNSILNNKSVIDAEAKATEAVEQGLEHPKMFKILELINGKYRGKSVIIFAQYRSTVSAIAKLLNLNGAESREFVGKKDGVTTEQQQRVVADFREGRFKVLAATSIAEEGLDIPTVDAVIFYEPVVSAIRNIQRRGRTGRVKFGEVVILVTKGTKDEAYNMIAHLREKRMREIVLDIKSALDASASRSASVPLQDGVQKRLG